MYIIPGDIIADILLRLPAKTVFRFRLVCKSWFNLITIDHDFIKMHLHHQQHEQKNHSILVFNFCSSTNRVLLHSINNNYTNCIHGDDINASSRSPSYPSTTIVISPPMYSNMHTNYDFMPLGFCNGLLCIYSSQKNVLLCEKICLWNPCTQEYKELPPSPPPPPLLPRTVDERVILNGFTNYGFGYDSINDDYKVVKNSYLNETTTVSGRNRYGIAVSVYTLGTNSWRRIGDLFPFVPHTESTPGVFVDGALYWMVSKPEPSMTTEIIICFQLGDEVYKEISFPPGVDVYEVLFGVVLKELKGSLCVFQDKYTIDYHKSIVVWVMNKADEQYSWAKFFTIAEQELSMELSMFHTVELIKPLGICNENDEILMEVWKKELVWLNLRDKKTRLLVAIPNEVRYGTIETYTIPNKVRYITIETYTMTESLVSLKKKGI